MKTTKTEIPVIPQFVPFNLTIVIENKEEAQAFYALINNVNNARLIGYRNADDMKDLIGNEFYIKSDIIANGVTYNEFYDANKH